MRRNALSSLALVFTAIIVVAGCSSSSPSTKAALSPSSAGAAAVSAPCHITRPAPPTVVPVAGTQHDYTMTSFDGAQNEFEKAQKRLQTVEDKLRKIRILVFW